MIEKIRIQGYRIYGDFTLHPNPRFNLIVGANESGKSTLVEAITLALTGKVNGLELSRFSGRVNTEIFSLSPSLGRGKLPPRRGGVKGGVRPHASFTRRLHVYGSVRS